LVAVHIISGKRRSCAFITIVQAYEICECLAKKNIFYLDLNRESVSEPRTLSEGYAILQFKESCLLFEYVKIAMYCFSITRLQCQMILQK